MDIYLKNTLDNIKSKLGSERVKFTFVSALIIFLITHIYWATNDFINLDDRYFYKNNNQTILEIGRWFLPIRYIFSYYELSAVQFGFSMLFLALSIVTLVEIFNIKSKTAIILIACVTITMPVNVYIFSFSFTSAGYIIGFFLSCFSFYIAMLDRKYIIIGSLLLACSIGTYQSFFAVATTLAVLSVIIMILENKKNYRELAVKMFEILIYLILSLIFYMAIMKIVKTVFAVEMSDYRSMENLGSIPAITLWPSLLVKTYKEFLSFFIGNAYFYNTSFIKLLNAGVLVLIPINIFIIYMLENLEKRKKYIDLLLIGAMIAILPFAVNILSFIMVDVAPISLTTHSFVLIFVFLMYTFDELGKIINAKKEKMKFSKMIHLDRVVVFLLIGIISYNYYLITNIKYLQLDRNLKATEHYYTSLITRMEQTEGFDASKNAVVFIGDVMYSGTFDFPETQNSYYNSDYLGIRQDKMRHFVDFANSLFGKKFIGTRNTGIEELLQKHKDEIMEMPLYPKAGSLKMIDGYLCIKFEPSFVFKSEQVENLTYNISISNDFLESKTNNESTFTWYIFENNDAIYKVYDTKDTSIQFEFPSSGEYSVRLNVVNGDDKVRYQEQIIVK